MKIQHKQCKNANFKDDLLDIYYQDLSEAMDVCRNLSTCAGVYDQDCDDKGLYKLCPKGSIHRAILPSCAHYKFGNLSEIDKLNQMFIRNENNNCKPIVTVLT